MKKMSFWFSKKMLWLLPVGMAIAFAVVFYIWKDKAGDGFTELTQTVPSIRQYGGNAVSFIEQYFPSYGAFAGIAFALIFLIVSSVLYMIIALLRQGKRTIAVPLALLGGVMPLLYFGHNMVAVSARYTAISGGIIWYIGYPLWYTCLIIVGICVLLLVMAYIKKASALRALFMPLILLFVLSGCDILNELTWLSCEFSSDPVHCEQESAVGSGEPENCDAVSQKKEFADAGSNPPQDKCYIMVAANTGDPLACDSIKGGLGSYSKEECLEGVFQNGNPDQCVNSSDEAACRNQYGARTGNCGANYTFDRASGTCTSGESAVDPECADPTVVSLCASSNTVLTCNNGKKRIEACAFGCFEAACRSSAGPTDIAPEPEPEQGADAQPDEKQPVDEQTGKEEPQEEDGEDEEEEEEAECEDDSDCFDGFTCEDNECVEEPECIDKDVACISELARQYCADGYIAFETCEFGCSDDRCLTQTEKAEKDKEKAEADACKAGYELCVSDVTLEVCVDGTKDTQKCEFGCDKNACRTEPKKKCTGLQRLNPFCSEDDDDIEDKLETDISTISDAVSGEYMDALKNAIENEKDPSKLRGLEAYKEFLEKAGGTLEDVQTDIQALKDLKRIFLDAYDPSMNIENMNVKKILNPGLFDRIATSIFGGPKTEAGKEIAEAEDSLAVYESMLNRQAEIDFLQKSRLDRLGEVITDAAKEKATSELGDAAKDIAEGVAGNAMIAVSAVDYALTSFQDEAKKQSFVGLARAYNRRRAELENANPNMDSAEIHRLTVAQVKDDPYQDAKGLTFIKYGNIVENADCQAETGNQLCIDNRVFWTAMDKTYAFSHKK